MWRRRLRILSATAGVLALAALAPASRPTQAQPAVGARSFKSGPIQITADGRWVWVANTYADAVERIDTADGSVKTFALSNSGQRDVPHGLSVTEDGREVWVAAHDTDRVYVLSGTDGSVAATIALPWGSGPYSIALSRPELGTGRQRWALVALHRSGSLAAIDTATRAVTMLPPVFRNPHGIAWTDDGETAWVTHLFPDGEHPHYSQVDVSGRRPRVSAHLNAFASSPRHSSQLKADISARNAAEGGYLNFRGHPAQLPTGGDARQLWVPTQYMNMTQDVPAPDAVIQATLRKLDLNTMRLLAQDKVILTAVNVHDPAKGDNNPPWLGYGWNAGVSGLVDIGFATLAGRLHAVVVGEQSNDIVVLPADTPMIRSATDPGAPGLPELPVGNRPMGVALSPTRATAYVYNALSPSVSVVDLTDPRRPAEARRIPLARREHYPSPDPAVLQGAKLFYSSADARLSANGKVSCASCHVNGEHDGRQWSFQHLPAGSNGQRHGPRSTSSLLGFGRTFTPGRRDPATGWGQVHRSGDRDEVQDFEHTFRSPLMGGRGFLGDRVQPEIGPPNAGRDADLDAIAAYVANIPPLARSPYRDPAGALTEAAVRGATFFMGADGERKPADAACATCHVPANNYVDFKYHDVGTYRPAGEQELNDGAKRGQCLWCGNTPTLVGVWDTAPYEGVFRWPETFADVLADFKDPERGPRHGRIAGLTGRQIRDLAAFVQSIDGDLPAAEVEGARDTSPPRIARVAPTSRFRVEVWFTESVDPGLADNTDNYVLTRADTGAAVPILAARPDGQNGDRVTLTTALEASAAGIAYRLRPAGGVRDLADRASGGVANVIDPADSANTHTFTLTDTLTITLGASGYENVTIPVHDASPVGSGLPTWSHDRVQAVTQGDNVTPGFVRFDWRAAFAGATGVRADDGIVDARFALPGQSGDARTLEIRRALQPWRDSPSGGDWNQNPVGGPTWRDHAHPDGPWNRPGAGALGGSGRDPADYNGRFDLAERVDAVVDIPTINAATVFGGPDVVQAFRFWFEHPELDYGYAIRARATRPSQVFVSFKRGEGDLQADGAVLTLTYRLSAGSAGVPTAAVAPTATPTRRPDEPTRTPTRQNEEPTRTATPRPDERTPTPTRRPDEPTRTATLRPDEPTRTATRRPDEPTRRPDEPTRTATPRTGDRDWWWVFLPWSGNRGG